MPNIKELLSAVGGYMTDEELKKTRDAIEALGSVCKCGDLKQTCVPLLTVQRVLNKNTK
jgi:hypothetical protein